jgi:hypothetical protein
MIGQARAHRSHRRYVTPGYFIEEACGDSGGGGFERQQLVLSQIMIWHALHGHVHHRRHGHVHPRHHGRVRHRHRHARDMLVVVVVFIIIVTTSRLRPRYMVGSWPHRPGVQRRAGRRLHGRRTDGRRRAMCNQYEFDFTGCVGRGGHCRIRQRWSYYHPEHERSNLLGLRCARHHW